MVAHRDTRMALVRKLFYRRGFRVHVEYPVRPRRFPPVEGFVRRADQEQPSRPT